VNKYTQYKTPVIEIMAFFTEKIACVMSCVADRKFFNKCTCCLSYECTELGLHCKDKRGYVTIDYMLCFYFYFVMKLILLMNFNPVIFLHTLKE